MTTQKKFPSKDYEEGAAAIPVADDRGVREGEALGAYDVVVVGGGLSGLVAAWKLAGHSVLVLERETTVGGAARSGQRGELRFATAGSCFQEPVPGSDTAQLLSGLGLSNAWRSTGDSQFVLFNTRHLLRGLGEVTLGLLKQPKELLNPAMYGLTCNLLGAALRGKKFIAAPKKLGDPVFAELYAYLQRFRKDGGKYPAVPWQAGCGWTREEMEQFDSMSLAELLFDEKARARLPTALVPDAKFGPLVRDAVETTLKVECLSAADVSAYVGLHFLVGYLYGTLVTFPGGNGYLSERLQAALRERGNCRIEIGARVQTVARDGERYRITFERGGVQREVSAGAVVWAAPKHAALDAVSGLPAQQQHAIRQIQHRDYCIANVYLRNAAWTEYFGGYVIEGNTAAAAPLAWCRSRVCVVANWLDRDDGKKAGVLTLLKPVAELLDQGKLGKTDFAQLQQATLQEVSEMLQAKGLSTDEVEDIRIWRWSRALVVATLGQMKADLFVRASQPVGGVSFANQDSVGIGNLESAVSAGCDAAQQAQAYLQRTAAATTVVQALGSGLHVMEIAGNPASGVQRFGGKANSLNTLIGAGFPVPRAYCVTVDACHAFLQASGLAAWIDGMDKVDRDTCADIRARIAHAPLPPALQDAIVAAYRELGSGPVAVRSSAVNEDGDAQSFAGQYDTFLHVEGESALLDCVKRCWASLWNERAHAYQGRNRADGGIAVVIQQMIVADAAGVLFTADPISGDAGRTVIESCWGLGEGVVSGQASTDTYVVDSDSHALMERFVRAKPVMCARTADGVAMQEVPPQFVDQPSLSDMQASELAACAARIRRHYGCELDIEWALKDDSIWILQARPITVTASIAAKLYGDEQETNQQVRENTMFSRMDTGEILTGLMTPLGLSFTRFYQHHVHGPAVKTMGLLDIGSSQYYVGYLQGHVYLNISASARLLTQCPPTHEQMKFTRRYATPDVDFTHYKNPYGEPVSGFQFFKSSLYWLVCQVQNLATAGGTVNKMIALRQRETERFGKLELEKMSLPQLDAELQRIDRYFLESCAAYMPFFLQSFALYDALAELCEKWLGNEGKGLQNRIKASMNNLRTIEVTRGVCELAARVDRLPVLRALFLETPLAQLADTLQQHAEGRRFWNEDFGAFLTDFGSRGRQEFELSIPRWNDDPTYLLQIIRLYLTSDVQLEARLATIGKAREEDTRQLLDKLPLKARMTFRFVIAAYAKMAERREATRPTFIAETWFYRKIIVEVLRRVEAEGVSGIQDLPYIDFNELRDYVAGRKTAQQAFSPQLIARNRQQHLLNERLKEPPMALIGGHVPQRDDQVLLDAAQGDLLHGLGASPGVAVGRARVITDLNRQAGEFRQGEILVARFTDASWTPLFVLAAGVVADIGSALSHSSIVSREFGIPAVVNAKQATQTIRTGDLIYLDGDGGVVRIEERVADTDESLVEQRAIA
ncbi:FAD-dependent oxidoreductase [Massilia rubra]|uniref:NAD(P)-binding protein n=1 Tax=Massilia rubra TaxID=2607910 RepID=A0ABX0M194_9BURK|nr:FAD-dependent oxidoreductase [Massilia rubra]NHZ38071.1 NAD(P)-binding protein [Massilia rubra]